MEILNDLSQALASKDEANTYASQLNQDPGWKDALDPCPCTEAEVKASPKFEEANVGLSTYHPGAQSGYRSSEPLTYQHSQLGEMHIGQQCTYDSHQNLITSGKAAGTPDSVSPEFSTIEHFSKDVLTYEALGHEKYNQIWTPNQGINCNHRFQNLNELKSAIPNNQVLDTRLHSTNPQLQNLKLDTPTNTLPSPPSTSSISSHLSPGL